MNYSLCPYSCCLEQGRLVLGVCVCVFVCFVCVCVGGVNELLPLSLFMQFGGEAGFCWFFCCCCCFWSNIPSIYGKGRKEFWGEIGVEGMLATISSLSSHCLQGFGREVLVNHTFLTVCTWIRTVRAEYMNAPPPPPPPPHTHTLTPMPHSTRFISVSYACIESKNKLWHAA